MSSTLGHALCGVDCLMVGRLYWPQLFPRIRATSVAAFAFLANLPDLDLLGGPLIGEHPHYFHGQITHSIIFAIFFAWVLSLATPWLKPLSRRTVFITGLVPVLSHVIVDWFTGPNPGINPSFGILIAWPFSSERIHAPITLFLGPHHASFDELFSAHNLWVMASELFLFGGAGVCLLLLSPSLRLEIKRAWQLSLVRWRKRSRQKRFAES
jgi:inner membrane protein